MAALDEMVQFLDAELRTAEIADYPGALNGLQMANGGTISRVAAAVDFSSVVVNRACAGGADLLIVHHGMFWGGAAPITGLHYARISTLVRSNLAVYASHLPLDVHPVLGNNTGLARALGLRASGGFAKHGAIDVGVSGTADVPTEELVTRATAFAVAHGGKVVATPFAPGRITRQWAICTGAGASSATIEEARQRGIDTVIVGEGPHHTAVAARDLGIVVIYAGHYATETLGVRALADALASRFAVEALFLDEPTGL